MTTTPHPRSTPTTIGLVGAGYMGSGLGWALRQAGYEVVTTLVGRSARTAELVARAGILTRPDLAAVVAGADIVLVVTPPDAAVVAAASIAEACSVTRAHPLIADLNATSPSTVARVAAALPGLDLVDGALSGPPPNVTPGVRIYLSGPRAAEVADLTWTHAQPVLVSDRIGDASAVKMSTASVYKGLTALLTQALRSADHYEVLEHVLADLAEGGYHPAGRIAAGAAKAWRFAPEMREIAATQKLAGLTPDLFEAIAVVYEQVARTDLAKQDPESVDAAVTPAEVLARLRS